ncbi:MAG: hypothetical protein R3C99_04930 [Pirellulaceae bacterium]
MTDASLDAHGDWFVERYESKAIGVAYTIFGLLFFMVYGSMFFSGNRQSHLRFDGELR